MIILKPFIYSLRSVCKFLLGKEKLPKFRTRKEMKDLLEKGRDVVGNIYYMSRSRSDRLTNTTSIYEEKLRDSDVGYCTDTY